MISILAQLVTISLVACTAFSQVQKKRSVDHRYDPENEAAESGNHFGTNDDGNYDSGTGNYNGPYGGHVSSIEVEKHVQVPIYKPIPYPFPQHIPHPVAVPVPIKVPHPIPIKVPVPVTVEKRVEVPVEKPVPYTVEKPYPVEVIKRIPYPVPKPYPVPVPVYKVKHIYTRTTVHSR